MSHWRGKGGGVGQHKQLSWLMASFPYEVGWEALEDSDAGPVDPTGAARELKKIESHFWSKIIWANRWERCPDEEIQPRELWVPHIATSHSVASKDIDARRYMQYFQQKGIILKIMFSISLISLTILPHMYAFLNNTSLNYECIPILKKEKKHRCNYRECELTQAAYESAKGGRLPNKAHANSAATQSLIRGSDV